jgi:hypothetical protein
MRLRLLACVGLLGAAGCSDEEAADEDLVTIKMGATISRTGSSAVGTWSNAYELAASDASEGLAEAGYPTGKRLKFEAEIADTKNDVAITVPAGIELVQEKGVKVLLDGTSADSLALLKLAYDDDSSNDIDVPIVCVACSSPAHHNPEAVNEDPIAQAAYRNEQGWHFGLSMSSVPQSQVLWNILVDKTPSGNAPGDLNGDGVVKVSTVAIDDPFGLGFQTALEKVLTEADPDAIYEKTTHPRNADLNEYDWQGVITALTDDQTDGEADSPPDVLIEFTFPNFSLAIVKAYSGEETPFLHTHSMRERTVIVSAESALDGHEGTSYLPSDGESGELFDSRFRSVVGTARQSQWDSHVYDGGILFALATLKATRDMEDPGSVTGAAIRDAMFELNDPDGEVIRIGPGEFAKAAQLIADGEAINYEGASGPVDFNEYGRALNRIAHFVVEDGEDKDLAVYDCVADSTCPKQ